MDIVTLARFQFGMTTIFHFFFVPLTIGSTFTVAIMETLYVTKKDEVYKKMAKFWSQIMLLSFAVGVVTGIIQEFQFGMNWSDYSRFVGDIFGAPLAVEALLAFFMESTFLGLWMFTWTRVKPAVHVAFIWIVSFGSLMSAFWIIVANSFMQHPVGFTLNNGRAEMNDFGTLVSNPQVWYEFSHVIFGAFVTGSVVVAGLSAFKLLKKESMTDLTKTIYQKSMRVGLWVLFIASFCSLMSGDMQMKALVEDQPMKFAATEGLYEDSGDPAAWTVVAWANESKKELAFGIDVPYMLSILSYNAPEGAVKGMNTINEEMTKKYGAGNYYPPVNTLFWSFRIMAGFGTLMFLLAALGLVLTRKKKPVLFDQKWLLWIYGLVTFAPFLANTGGWVVTEMGRYPWTVYGLFKIEDSVSPNVSVTSLFISNTIYFLLFAGLGSVMVYLVIRELKKGPEYVEHQHEKESTPAIDPFDGGAF